MRTIKIKSLTCDNFKCFKHKKITFNNEKTTVSGRNGIGKSTIYDAIMWLLFDVTATGDTAKNVRPHDTDGNDIHFIDIVVEGTFDVDGREITLKKTQKENWRKSRITQKQEFKGNDNTFECNGIPKKASDYKAYIAENLCDADTFLSCTNSKSFFRLDTKKRRKKLLELAKEVTDDDVIATDKRFNCLADTLKDGTVEEIIKRSNDTIKLLNKELDALPVRIDEQEKSKVDIDVAELELRKNELEELYKEADGVANADNLPDYSRKVLEIKFELNDFISKANEQLYKERTALENDLADAEHEIESCKASTTKYAKEIDGRTAKLEALNKELAKEVEQWHKANAREFDENSLFCPYCEQEYPQSKKEQIRRDFDDAKKKELAEVTAMGNQTKSEIQKITQELSDIKDDLVDIKERMVASVAKQDEVQKKLDAMPKEVDLSDNEDFQKLQKEYDNLMMDYAKRQGSMEGAELKKKSILDDLDKVKSELAIADRNNEIDERISELEQAQRDTAQKTADEERMLDLLEDFNKTKMRMLTDQVNKHFSRVKFRLFEPLINGSYRDVCYATVNGTSYEHGLNDSDCLLADLDILQAFQQMSNLNIFLVLDRAESINDDRVPETESQLILLRVSDGKEMEVR